jgi:ketosteroid isomerase-like protein
MSLENVEVVRRGVEVMNRGGLDALRDFVDEVADPSIEVSSAGLPDVGRVHGREAAKDWFAQILGTFDWQVEATEFIDAGDVVVVVARQTGRGRESGAKATQSIVYSFGFREGKVTYFEAHRTKRGALAAAGLSE